MTRPDEILNTLEQAGFAAFYVGGCVRDTLLGRPIHDWDITTAARPEQTMALFPRCVPTGLNHGTVTVLLNGEGYEVTTFRQDGAYRDGRHPEEVRFVPELKDDLARRDFTVNAMAMRKSGEIIDLFGGKEDLRRRLIRCVGAPDRRFQEDALRMLRAWRFSAQLGFSIEEDTARAIRENASRCRSLSRERICAETEKTLLSPRPELLGQLIRLGLLAACGLEGEYDLSALRDTPDGSDVRWTKLQLLLPALDLRQFRLPAKKQQRIEAAAAAYQAHYTRAELKKLLAEHGEDAAFICAKLSGQEALLKNILQSGECFSLRTLSVSGRDFPSLPGKAVGALLRALLAHVLSCPEDNDRQTLLHLAEVYWKSSDLNRQNDVADV